MRRFFESIPGILSWTTLFLMVFLSWQKPVWIAFFIILFDIYWLFKSLYLSLHLRATFKKMREYLKISWQDRLTILANWKSIHHLVILPMADEPYEVVRETFESLAKTNYPKEKLFLVLAIEERAGKKAVEISEKIKKEFSGIFSWLIITKHPADLAGEIPGKGSNEAWAAGEAKKIIIDKLNLDYEKVLISAFDVDTQIYPDYFGCLTYHFLTAENPQRSSYQPIPLFINNIYQAPALARVISFSATFWQMMQQSRPERLTTFSSHAMPFKALVEIGYWQKDIVSEDSRIFWQCYLHYGGDWRVVPLFYPVSMDANVARTFWQTLVNLYKQQRRWAWGAENFSYMVFGFLKNQEVKLQWLRKQSRKAGLAEVLLPGNKSISFQSKIYWTFNLLEGLHSWATSSLMIFALGWLPILIGGGSFNQTLLSYNLPIVTRYIMTFASLGIASSAILSIMLLPKKSEKNQLYNYAFYFLQWALMPITLIIFGAFPALEAQTRLMMGGKWRLGFWVTPKIREGSPF